MDEPFIFFEQQAYKFREKLDLPTEFIGEAIDILRNAFGEEWIRTRANSKDKSIALPLRDHPIGEYFSTPSESQIVGALELAVYLKRLMNVKKIEKVITQMKDKFYPHHLQLAFGYRFLRCGATELEFEPEALSGRFGDIFFKIDGKPIMVECYVPHIQTVDTSREFHYSTGPIFKSIKDGKKRICIHLVKSITPEDRKRIQTLIINAISSSSNDQIIELKDEAATISIEDISFLKEDSDFSEPGSPPMKLYGDADWGVNEQRIAKEQIPDVRLGTAPRNILSRIFVWKAPQEKNNVEIEERIKELEKKIKDKLAQTKHNDGAGRFLIINIPEALDLNSKTFKIVKCLNEEIIRKCKNMAGMILTRRIWTDKNRYIHGGMLMEGHPQYRFINTFYDKLNLFERGNDIIKDYK